ncbi:NTP transferase domain-containing protein [Gordonia sp. VNK21]|uniref:NTP transferase domain-containing protein n=1 Tax=Gordonia sp. VNK21 TaxID=3382483 RepID=UPI0038D3897C
MRLNGTTASGDRIEPIAGIVLVARGDESAAPVDDEVPQNERLRILLDDLSAGGCDELYVVLGSRLVVPPTDSSTTFYLPGWFEALDESVGAAIDFARSRPDLAGVLLQTVDAPVLGEVGVRRVLAAAGGSRDTMARATWNGRPSQPVYVGAGMLAQAAELVAQAGGAVAYLDHNAAALAQVDCSDLTSTP